MLSNNETNEIESLDSLCMKAEKLLLLNTYNTQTNDGNDIHSNTNKSVIKEIVKDSNDILNGIQLVHADMKNFHELLLNKQKSIDDMLTQLKTDVFIEDMKKYLLLRYELEILSCCQAINELKSWKKLSDIPGLVLNISIPKGLTKEMKLYKLLIEVVDEVKGTLLNQFKNEFEANLNESNTESKASIIGGGVEPLDMVSTAQHTVAKEPTNASNTHWTNFIENTKEWLTSYALVALLPYSRDSQRIMLDRFTEVLDVTLTPLWGRYHFHLQHSLEAKSFEQLLWTFKYTADYISMLDVLCNVSLTGEDNYLQSLQKNNYQSAARSYIVDKACKFMRAHVAHVIDSDILLRNGKEGQTVEYDDEITLQLIENCLSLDDFLNNSVLNQPSSTIVSTCVAGTCTKPLQLEQSISMILYDQHSLYCYWLAADMSYFVNAVAFELVGLHQYQASLKAIGCDLSESDYVYSVETYTLPSIGHDNKCTEIEYACYQSIHKCCYLFQLACLRYIHQSKQSQIILSKCVLEPLLCSLLTIVLYRMRTHPYTQLLIKIRNYMKVRSDVRNILVVMGLTDQSIIDRFVYVTNGVIHSCEYITAFMNVLLEAYPMISDIVIGVDETKYRNNSTGNTTHGTHANANTGKTTKDLYLNIESIWCSCQEHVKILARNDNLVSMDTIVPYTNTINVNKMKVDIDASNLITRQDFNINTGTSYKSNVLSDILKRYVLKSSVDIRPIISLLEAKSILINCNAKNQLTLKSSIEYVNLQLQALCKILALN